MRFTAQHHHFDLDIKLPIAAHERIGIVGPNGAGKSTLLAQWLQLNAAAAGSPETVLLHQRSLCFPHLNVIENVAFPQRSRGVAKADAHAQALAMLSNVDLPHLAEQYPRELSGGQQQQIALLRALATGANTVLLDEPLAGLDVLAAREYRDLLGKLGQSIHQLVVVTHDSTDLLHLVDRIVVIDQGTLVADLPVTEFVASPPNAFSEALVQRNQW